MSLNWKYRETSDSEYGTAFFAGLKLVCRDCDGDFSTWSVTDPKIKGPFTDEPRTIASGECHTGDYKTDPYHFYLAQQVAEECARAIGRERRKQREAASKAEQSA